MEYPAGVSEDAFLPEQPGIVVRVSRRGEPERVFAHTSSLLGKSLGPQPTLCLRLRLAVVHDDAFVGGNFLQVHIVLQCI